MAIDFTLIAGTDRALRFNVVDIDGIVVDIGGADIVWVAAETTDGAPVITKSTDVITEINITDATGGLFEVYLVPTDTYNVAGMTYYHEARTIIGSIQEVVHQGQFTVTYDISYGHMP